MRTRSVKVLNLWDIGRINKKILKKLIIAGCVIIAVISLILLFNVTSSAKNTYNYNTCYSTICVESGTTLWDIATTNYSVEYGDFDDYINEIRSLNHLSKNDMIHAGEYIVIPVCK